MKKFHLNFTPQCRQKLENSEVLYFLNGFSPARKSDHADVEEPADPPAAEFGAAEFGAAESREASTLSIL